MEQAEEKKNLEEPIILPDSPPDMGGPKEGSSGRDTTGVEENTIPEEENGIKRTKKTRTRRSLMRKMGVALLGLALALTAYLGIYLYALSIMDNTEIELQRIRILESDHDTLRLEVELLVSNPSSHTARLEESDLDLVYEGKKAAYLSLPSFKIGPGDNSLTLAAQLKEQDRALLLKLADEILNSRDVELRLVGTMKTDGFVSLELQVDKTLMVPGSSQGPEIDIRHISIPEGRADGIDVEINLTVTNPTIIETTLDGLEFEILYKGTPLATIGTSGFLETGENMMDLTFLVPSSVGETATALVSEILEGKDTSFEVRGKNSSSLLSRLTAEFSYDYADNNSSLSGLANLQVEVEEISILDGDNTGIFAEIEALVFNPSIIGTTLDGLDFRLLYDGSELAVFETSGYLKEGMNFMQLSLFMPAHTSSTANELIDAILDGNSAGFDIKGEDRDGLLLSRLGAAFSYHYVLEDSGGIEAHVRGFQISSIGLFTSKIDVDTVLENASPISADISSFGFTAYYQGQYLGPVEFDDPHITPGSENKRLTLVVGTITLQNLGILTKLTLGSPVEILIEGKRVFDQTNTLEFYLTVTL